MDKPVTAIVIIGGGTAGWLSACYIASRSRALSLAPLTITLIESPDIPTIGVGEGTWPTIRGTLSDIGLSEADVLASCDGSFKQGSRFDGWVTGSKSDSYYHPFTAPPEGEPIDIVAAWQKLVPGTPYAFATSPQPAVCKEHLAPKQGGMDQYSGALNYAYHLDAGKLAARLSSHAVEALGVVHRRDKVVGVEALESGGVKAVLLRSGERIEGDLFIDCSGHAALLIGGHCGAGWIDCSGILANDRALAVQVAVDGNSPIESQTIGTAHEAGWIWDIGLPTRRGVGCVYSSRFLDDEQAEAILRSYIAATAGKEQAQAAIPRALSFRSGHRSEFWHGNCLAIGLSAGFVEPLEASAIVLIELSLRTLMDNFPRSAALLPLYSSRFNERFRTYWERIVEFLKLHYVLSKREEPYWRSQRSPATVPTRLADLLQLWRAQPPSSYDLPLAEEIFPAASYQCVYYGMGGLLPERLPQPGEQMRRQFDKLHERTRGLLAALPPNRVLLRSLAAAGSVGRAAQA